jgi:glutathione peroxidase
MASIYDFTARTLDGKERALSDFRGKVLLIVNTASACGFTPQYAGLEKLNRKHADKGLVVLGFPCNQFANQEPGDAEEIASFCKLTYDVTFPMMAKVDVNGPKAHPLYAYLTKTRRGALGNSAIMWNFTKFLIGRDGRIIARYGPQVSPAMIEGAIVRALG